ncbi:MAG: DUF3810 domain-containing protein [Lachnospiraceae bacterium]|nr:DUF3810 domain-containing protein [Lachnospiraceae bacterium]
MKKVAYKISIGILLLLTLAINIAAWNSRDFSDFYRKYIFQKISPLQSRISNIFSCSIGEVMILIGLFLVVVFVCTIVALVVFRKKEWIQRIGKGYLKFFVLIFAIVSLIMTSNCFVAYHASDFETVYMSNIEDREYTVEELILVRDYVIEQANALAYTFERDDRGYIIYDEEEIKKQAKLEMKRMGQQYPLLKGYYPNPKPIAASKFLSQQYMLGYYFPFSMEANYNKQMYVVNMPATMCHELSHLKGFMYEDDANFIGYLTCISSENPFFRYSGYVSMLDYLNNALFENLGGNVEAYLQYKQCDILVAYDNMFLTREAWEEVEEAAVFDTETVKQASHTFVETNLNLNGIEEGVASYGRVVEYLLKYYDGVLYEKEP